MSALQRFSVFETDIAPARGPARREAPGEATFELAWLDATGRPAWEQRRLPDTAEVNATVASFARATLLSTPTGKTPVEDLRPGDLLSTVDGGETEVTWIGSRDLFPAGAQPTLYRVAPHAFGGRGPAATVILGASAHVLLDDPRCMALVGGLRAFAPVSAFEDGERVAAIVPPGDGMTFGIACAGQAAILASGLPVATVHPARAMGTALARGGHATLARLFPHLSGGATFDAPRIPTLTLSEARDLTVARAA